MRDFRDYTLLMFGVFALLAWALSLFILALQTRNEWWLLGLIPWIPAVAGFTLLFANRSVYGNWRGVNK